jgi:hypothetical protein
VRCAAQFGRKSTQLRHRGAGDEANFGVEVRSHPICLSVGARDAAALMIVTLSRSLLHVVLRGACVEIRADNA